MGNSLSALCQHRRVLGAAWHALMDQKREHSQQQRAALHEIFDDATFI
jgi:hypothetical protein